MALQRLQKIIAGAGVTSRRKAEQLIVDGRVAVNGVVVRELGASADRDLDLVTLDGRSLRQEAPRYLVVNKPAGVLCAVSDDRGRRVIVDLVPERIEERVFPAGRLDLDSEGLVLLTNDGELMYAVTRPGGPVAKIYDVTVRGSPSEGALEALRTGIDLDDKETLPCEIERLGPDNRLRVVLHEGRKNQIRRMFRSVEHRVERLVRLALGPIELADLGAGEVRELGESELQQLRHLCGLRAGAVAARAPERGEPGAQVRIEPGQRER